MYFLVLGLTALVIAIWGESIFFKDGTYTAVKVACYNPDDSEVNGLGFNVISHLKGFQGSLNFELYDSEEQVREAVEEGEAAAGLILPENFVYGVAVGTNPPVEVIYRSADTFDELMVNDAMTIIADELGIGQACVQTTYMYCDQVGITGDRAYIIANNVAVDEISYAVDQLGIFKIKDIDDIADHTLSQKIIAGALVYIFLISVFVFAYFCKGSNEAFIARGKLSGVKPYRFFIIESLSVASMMYIVYLMLFIIMYKVRIGAGAGSLYRMIPVLIILSVIVTGMCYLFKTPISASYISFAVFTVLMYLAGGLVPLEFLPRFLQKGAVFNPLRYLIDFTMEALFS